MVTDSQEQRGPQPEFSPAGRTRRGPAFMLTTLGLAAVILHRRHGGHGLLAAAAGRHWRTACPLR